MVLGEDQIRLLRQVVSQLYLHQSLLEGLLKHRLLGPKSEFLINKFPSNADAADTGTILREVILLAREGKAGAEFPQVFWERRGS